MNLKLYYTSSENNQLNKQLTLVSNLTGTLRDTSNVVRPTIMIETDSIGDSNYAYIPTFHRYYYIRDAVSIRNGLWLLELESDPLMSFYGDIIELTVVLKETESYGTDDYIADDRVWITKVKDKTNIINFPNGLLDTGTYVLITAGGGGNAN